MSTPNGYNNPAYCHQYDPSLYEYQYVPEIDPDSPDLRDESNKKILHQTKLVHPDLANFSRESSESSEFGGSDESKGSIIIEECNNRRVTLICEKRPEEHMRQKDFYDDRNLRGAYYQDISLESENGYEGRHQKKQIEERSFRHQRPLDPHMTSFSHNENTKVSRNPSLRQPTASTHGHQRAQRYHRYEEIPYDEDYRQNEPKQPPVVHRYAEITVDENGFPSLSQEIKIEHRKEDYRQKENNPPKLIPKPRAISPVNYPNNFSPPQTPSRTPQKSAKEFEYGISRFSPNSPKSNIYCSSPIRSNSFEMSELSPPRISNERQRDSDHTFFINSPKRHPPIGASATVEPLQPNERCILPKNLQQINEKSGKRCYSLPNSPRRRRDSSQAVASPGKTQSNKKVTQIFHIKSSKPKYKSSGENTPARKNISNYFVDQPNDSTKMLTRSPYKPTTVEINPQKTAVITPIFQRKNQGCVSPKRNFEKMSQTFQSTGNICRSVKENSYPENDFPSKASHQKFISPGKIKRNQSVPNFIQTLATESRMIARNQGFEQGTDKFAKNLDLQYSPKKPSEHVFSIDKSRISLIEQASSWSTLESDYHPRCGGCFIFATFVHLLTASATCAISFYLLSKLGRKYYLDFGLLAGFVNFILGLLGFRSYCWRWLPNRNYVSGFIGLAAFSALTCAGLTYLITARPMAGDPILDIMGGAICAVSVLTIVLALTGLTMSGCCKAPPPDNRVNDI